MAIYVSDIYQSELILPPGDNAQFELSWIKLSSKNGFELNSFFIGGIYHPPKPIYNTNELCSFITSSVEFILSIDSNQCNIIVAGDTNNLNDDVFTDSGLDLCVHVATHKGHFLDKIFTLQPIYSNVKAVKSCIKTEHAALVARADIIPIIDYNKARTKIVLRKPSPAKNAAFIAGTKTYDWSSIYLSSDTQVAADRFYNSAISLLNAYFPETSVTITSRDPSFITPAIKQLLRRKNCLLRRGLTDKANALSQKIKNSITASNAGRLACKDKPLDTQDLWRAVRDITGKSPSFSSTNAPPTVDAISLNSHYASISSDSSYTSPAIKYTCQPNHTWPSEMHIFYTLDHLKPTASGPDLLPSWFLRLGAPFFARPLSHLFNLSICQSTVPSQWKSACIFPLPKIAQPTACSDYRPISLTPILCRVMERLLLKEYFYPLLLDHPYPLKPLLNDQFAFRPTGSTTSALISLLSSITNLLETNAYVHLITFDFSKAFDTVRHSSLMTQLATVGFPDQFYNWIINFLSGRTHTTKFKSCISPPCTFNAGVVQGSAIGPAVFSLCVSGYRPITDGNIGLKYADDMYLLVPASNSASITTELAHISSWAASNNLRLNSSKSAELIVKKPRSRAQDPPIIAGLPRVTSLKVLGVTLQDNLLMSQHVGNAVAKAGQATYALKLVKSYGLPPFFLNTVAHAILSSVLTYASPAWAGFINSDDQARLQAPFNRAHRWGLFSSPLPPSFSSLCDSADQTLFSKIVTPGHVLYSMLPGKLSTPYNLRRRVHPYVLPPTSNSLKRNFLHRMLYKLANILQKPD